MHKVIKKLASWLIRDEISEIQKNERQAGIKLGDEAGYSRGLSEGYQNGFNAGKSIFILKDERTVAVSHAIDNSIYGPRYLPVSPSLSQQM